MPIKTQEGYLVKNLRKNVEKPEEAAQATKEPKVKRPAIKEIQPEQAPKTVIELIREKKLVLEKNKEKIALFSRDILQNPQEEVIWNNSFEGVHILTYNLFIKIKKLKELRTMLTYSDIRSSFILRKLIILSLCEIYKDIIPSYKIRSWTEKENEQNVI